MVLDPFCGCATTCIAAELEGRRWAGIDIDSTALDVTMDRLRRQVDRRNNVSTRGESDTEQLPGLVRDATSGEWAVPEVVVSDKPPLRTDPDRPARSPRIRAIRWHDLGTGERRPCPGCQRRKCSEDFDLDHITPRSKGGLGADENLQLLCRSCDSIKGQRLTMAELRQQLLTDTRQRLHEATNP